MVTLAELQQRQQQVRKRLAELPGQIQQADREQRRGASAAGQREFQTLQAEEASLQLQIKQQQLQAAGASEFEQYQAGVTPGQIAQFSQQRTAQNPQGYLAAEQVRRQVRSKTGELTGQPGYVREPQPTSLPGTIDRKKTTRELVPGQPTRLREERPASLQRKQPQASSLYGSVEPPVYYFYGLQGSRKTIQKFQKDYRETFQSERARKGTQPSSLAGSVQEKPIDINGAKASSRFDKKLQEYEDQLRRTEKADIGLDIFGKVTRAELAIRTYDPFEPFTNLRRAGEQASIKIVRRTFPETFPEIKPLPPDSPSSYTRAIIRSIAKLNTQNQQLAERLKPARAEEIQKDLTIATVGLEAGVQAVKKFEKKGLLRQVVTGPTIAALRTAEVITGGTALAIGTSRAAAPELAVFVKGLSPFATTEEVYASARKAQQFGQGGEFAGRTILSKVTNLPQTSREADAAFGVFAGVVLKDALKEFKQRPLSFATEQATYIYGPRLVGKLAEYLEIPLLRGTEFGKTKAKYQEIESALIKQFGEESPEVASYRAEFRRAFYDLPRRTEPKQAFTVEPTKAAQELNIPKEAIEKINKKLTEYKSFTIGSLGFPEGPARIFSADIDVQAVLPRSPKGSKNIYGKQLAEDILGILNEYDVKTPEGIKPSIKTTGPKPKAGGGLLKGETKYSVEFAKGKEVLYEFANIGESTGYFVKTQLPSIRRPFDTSLYDFLPTGKTGLRQGNIPDQFRKAFEISYLKGRPSEVVKRIKLVSQYGPNILAKDVEALKAFKIAEEKLGGKGASRLIDVKGYFQQTEKLFNNGRFIGKKVPIKDILKARLEESGPVQYARRTTGDIAARLFLGKRGQALSPINLLVVPARYESSAARPAGNYAGLLVNVARIKPSTYETPKTPRPSYSIGVPIRVPTYPGVRPPKYPSVPPTKYPPLTPPKYPPVRPPKYPPSTPPKYPPSNPPTYPPGIPPPTKPPVISPPTTRVPPKPPRPPRPPPPRRKLDKELSTRVKKRKPIKLAFLPRKTPPSLFGVAAGLTTTKKKLSRRVFTGLEARGVPTLRRRKR